ncbi:MAG: hypothetical protein WCL61_03105, partial [bacterium]
KADEEFDFSEIGINDLQPRWVTPRPVDALGYTIAKKRQVRIYDFTKVNDIFRYDIHQNRTHDGEFMAGESVVAHNGYTDEDAKKLKLGKFSKQKLAHELIKDYKNNQQPNYVEIENVNTGKVGRIPMPKKSDLGDNEYVMRNKDLKEHLSAVYEAIDGG